MDHPALLNDAVVNECGVVPAQGETASSTLAKGWSPRAVIRDDDFSSSIPRVLFRIQSVFVYLDDQNEASVLVQAANGMSAWEETKNKRSKSNWRVIKLPHGPRISAAGPAGEMI